MSNGDRASRLLAQSQYLKPPWGNPVDDIIEDIFAMPPQTSFRREVRDAKRDGGERS